MNDLFLSACLKKPVSRTPVWIMRQAGRYMKEYREIRKKYDFWTVCKTAELATKVTLQPVDRIGVDAAILFSDILIGLPAMGCNVEFSPGPVVDKPVRNSSDIENLKIPDPHKDLGFVMDAIKSIRHELKDSVPLIGFGGAPLTLAAYMIEGKGSKDFIHLKSLLYGDSKSADLLMSKLVDAQALFLNAQIEAGAQAIQIFDTWAGNMNRQLYKRFVLDPVSQLIERIKKPGVPVIYFMRDSLHVLDLLSSTGANVLSMDDKIPLSKVAKIVGPGPALQGNMDSTLMLGSQKSITDGVAHILDDFPVGHSHIFNLGHGILPPTPTQNAVHLVETVKRLSLK